MKRRNQPTVYRNKNDRRDLILFVGTLILCVFVYPALVHSLLLTPTMQYRQVHRGSFKEAPVRAWASSSLTYSSSSPSQLMMVASTSNDVIDDYSLSMLNSNSLNLPKPTPPTQRTSPKAVRSDAGQPLSAVSVSTPMDTVEKRESNDFRFENLFSVITTALLVTGNTVGAGCLVLPTVAEAPGMGISTILFVALYCLNLISGLALAEVAINQYESSGTDVPSSFKEFAEANLSFDTDIHTHPNDLNTNSGSSSSLPANMISGLSIFSNTCVMIFAFARIGQLAEPILHFDPIILSLGWATAIGGLLFTMSGETLSVLASVLVTATMTSFIGLLLPGLMSLQDPLQTFIQPGIASVATTDGTDSFWNNIGQAAPVMLTTLVYQNIVPSVAKLQNYDRRRTTSALVIGSIIPLFMYITWCLVALGGGISMPENGELSMVGPFLTIFSFATTAGATIGAAMSLSEEFELFVGKKKKGPMITTSTTESDSLTTAHDDYYSHTKTEINRASKREDRKSFSLAAVFGSISIPMLGVLAFHNGNGDFTQVLKICGTFGTPLLYGAIPALMVWNQRRVNQRSINSDFMPLYSNAGGRNLVPGGLVSLGFLGILSITFVSEELVRYASYIWSTIS